MKGNNVAEVMSEVRWSDGLLYGNMHGSW